MKCGHVANAFDKNGSPVCAICIGIDEGATQVQETMPDLTGRKAKCRYCNTHVDSSFRLPFFEYKEDQEEDSFYCGCFGWD